MKDWNFKLYHDLLHLQNFWNLKAWKVQLCRCFCFWVLLSLIPYISECTQNSSFSSRFGDQTFLIMTDKLLFSNILWHILWHSGQLHSMKLGVTLVRDTESRMMRDNWLVQHSQHAQPPIAWCCLTWFLHWRFRVQIITQIYKDQNHFVFGLINTYDMYSLTCSSKHEPWFTV